MKKTTLLFFLMLAFIAGSQAQTKTLKFGHVNSQELLQKMPEMDQALSALEDLQTSNNEKLKLMQDELQSLNTQYVSVRNTMNAASRQEKELELQGMDQNIRAFYQNTQQQMQQKQQELTQPIIEKARKAVEEVGAENGFMYIFDISKGEVLFMGDQSVDVLPLVLKKLGIAADAPAQ